MFEFFGVHKKICSLIAQSMLFWRTTLTCCGVVLGDVEIYRGIFQGKSLSPILFVIALMPLSYLLQDTNKGYCLKGFPLKVNHLLYLDDIKLYGKSRSELHSLISTVSVFSGDICMSFGIDKCFVASLYRGQLVESPNAMLPSGDTICSLKNEESYRYLGILESGSIQHQTMKQHLTKEYIRRVRKILSTQLYGNHTVQAVNSFTVPLLRYSAGLIHWTKEELYQLDVGT